MCETSERIAKSPVLVAWLIEIREELKKLLDRRAEANGKEGEHGASHVRHA